MTTTLRSTTKPLLKATVAAILPPPSAEATADVITIAIMEARIRAKHGPTCYLLKALGKLRVHLSFGPTAEIPYDLAAFDRDFPKSTRGRHPRPDLDQGLDAYRKWRADARRAIEDALGRRDEKAARAARLDGWADLLDAIALHSGEGGAIHDGASRTVARLADLGRRQDFEPWDLASPATLEAIEVGLVAPEDRAKVRDAIAFLDTHRFLDELAAVLPPANVPLVSPPLRRDLARLPDHVEAVIAELVEVAAVKIDLTTNKPCPRVDEDTRNVYFAALRHHMRTLDKCPPAPELDYVPPAGGIASVNDVDGLFAPAHVAATIRWTEENQHLPGTIEARSAGKYYSIMLFVLKKAGSLPDGLAELVKSSRFLQEGREAAEGMTPDTQAWCQALVIDPDRERRFSWMHLTMKRRADKILETARKEQRKLTATEITQVRALGSVAAATAIQLTGRAIRIGNVLGLRLAGPRRNFFAPTRAQPTYGFHLTKEETKARAEEPRTNLLAELRGAEVLDWYLDRIRPLFPHAQDNVHLFPSITKPGDPLDYATFDPWFQRAAAAVDLPMTFHRFRHGKATLLLKEDWGNLPLAAAELGNTIGVCARNYAWLDKQALYEEGQKVIVKRAKRMGPP
jgi:integrase